MKNEILRTIIAYPESTIKEVNEIVQKTFKFCAQHKVKEAMVEHKIRRVRVRGNLYKFDIPSKVYELVGHADSPRVQKSKVDRVWTPEMKTCALAAVMEREKHRWRYS